MELLIPLGPLFLIVTVVMAGWLTFAVNAVHRISQETGTPFFQVMDTDRLILLIGLVIVNALLTMLVW